METPRLPRPSQYIPKRAALLKQASFRVSDGARMSLLLVEDHAPSASVLAFLLRQEGYLVDVAACADDALRLAADKRFDLVISDIGLPDGDGRTLMNQLHTRYALSGIALTGYVDVCDNCELRECGFLNAVAKPIEFTDLFTAIRDASSRTAD